MSKTILKVSMILVSMHRKVSKCIWRYRAGGTQLLSPITRMIKSGYSYQWYYNCLSQPFVILEFLKLLSKVSLTIYCNSPGTQGAYCRANVKHDGVRREFAASLQETDTFSLCHRKEVNKPAEDLSLLIPLSTSNLEAI